MPLKKMEVFYVPYRDDWSHPADRRRLLILNSSRDFHIQSSDPANAHLVFLSNGANFAKWIDKARVPVVIDLVDGYLGENSYFLKDFFRNTVRSLKGESSLKWITYTRHLRYACKRSDIVIVASIEQAEIIKKFNLNVKVILDDHSELAKNDHVFNSNTIQNGIFWEGFAVNLKHFKFIADELDDFIYESNLKLYLVTERYFYKFSNRFVKVDTLKLIKKLFPKSFKSVELVDWSIESLREIASKAKFAIIPLEESDKFAQLKSENKLLSMWVLNAPCLVSPTPSYQRVIGICNQHFMLVNQGEWGNKLREINTNKHLLEDSISRGHDYLQQHHTREILIQHWKDALNSVSPRPENAND
jgi:hypothetical protein